MDYSPPGSSVYGILQQEYLSGLPYPPPGDLPDPGIKPGSPTFQADPLPFEPLGKPDKKEHGNLQTHLLQTHGMDTTNSLLLLSHFSRVGLCATP